MRLAAALASVLLASCLDEFSNDSLGGACGAPCWPSDLAESHRGNGICQIGHVECDGNGASSCVGTYPSDDVCNGIDDDCDGRADNWPTDRPRSLCLQLGECLGAEPRCDGTSGWSCVYRDTVQRDETRCDGLDNDCDGLTDEMPPQGPCYSGPVGTEQGECRPGWLRCVDGDWLCDGETTPAAELCNGLDDDCDGVPDDGYDASVDVAIGMDDSGSMELYAPHIRLAIEDASAGIADSPLYTWGLTLYGTWDAPYWVIAKPLGELYPVLSALRALGFEGSIEPTQDAIAETCLLMPWRDGARRVVVAFADETIQWNDPAWQDPLAVEDECNAAGVDIHVWAPLTGLWLGYDSFATVHELVYDRAPMAAEIYGLIASDCD